MSDTKQGKRSTSRAAEPGKRLIGVRMREAPPTDKDNAWEDEAEDERVPALRKLRDMLDNVLDEEHEAGSDDEHVRAPLVSEVMDCGLLPHLLRLLRAGRDCPDEDVDVQVEAAGVLANLAAGDEEHATRLVNAGVLPVVFALLDSPHSDVAEQAACVVGNIASAHEDCRDVVLGLGVLDRLLPLAECDEDKPDKAPASWVVWTLRQLCTGTPRPSMVHGTAVARALAKMLAFADAKPSRKHDDVLRQALKGLGSLADADDKRFHDELWRLGVMERAVPLLNHRRLAVARPALRLVSTLTSVDPNAGPSVHQGAALVRLLREKNVFASVVDLLGVRAEPVRRDVCWLVSNLGKVDGGTMVHDLVHTAHLIPDLLDAIQFDVEDVCKEATWSLNDMLRHASEEHVRAVTKAGCVPAMARVLTLDVIASWAIESALFALHDVLHVAAGDLRADMHLVAGGLARECGVFRRTPEELLDMVAQFTWRPSRVAWELEECGGLDTVYDLRRDKDMPTEVRGESHAIIAKFFDGHVLPDHPAPRVQRAQ